MLERDARPKVEPTESMITPPAEVFTETVPGLYHPSPTEQIGDSAKSGDSMSSWASPETFVLGPEASSHPLPAAPPGASYVWDSINNSYQHSLHACDANQLYRSNEVGQFLRGRPLVVPVLVLFLFFSCFSFSFFSSFSFSSFSFFSFLSFSSCGDAIVNPDMQSFPTIPEYIGSYQPEPIDPYLSNGPSVSPVSIEIAPESSQQSKTARRRAQNREAQRLYRDRQQNCIKDLRTRLEDSEAELARLRKENQKLHEKLGSMKGGIMQLMETVVDPASGAVTEKKETWTVTSVEGEDCDADSNMLDSE
ncbi:hypothetical protein MBM_04280 [Drepanopeziza brunnea f. sp. 'multigermtubi' MB_m1]|uniref:BZIP domain-containing protein n=1 Tax=Marssonina brunnea f. sp. multigermtubi (strain MB_m1) TaxID=1072389 RepID=K1XX96_MARBU|nr:uncharacterized protein MBM_04280 [Drepanopeziza brunnea f. sp. 'multigermtubi' MB_m1]EKD17419.1 hypothetical protein MBM_04280 [Drepanopeziza brunnea f. sp. 'multigermtubi' MB_m1]